MGFEYFHEWREDLVIIRVKKNDVILEMDDEFE